MTAEQIPKEDAHSSDEQMESNIFTSKEAITKAMKKHYPIAAIDIETAKFYSKDDMNRMKLESLLC